MTKAYDLAKAEIGTVEWAEGSNPKVVAYYRDAGHPEVKDDETAWCAAFVGAMLKRAGSKGTGQLTARSYLKWGKPVAPTDARQGDVVIIPRGGSTWQGHVFFIDRIDGDTIYGLGGNQRDAVNIQRYSMKKVLGIRRDTMVAITSNPVDVSETPAGAHQTGWFMRLLRAIFGKNSA